MAPSTAEDDAVADRLAALSDLWQLLVRNVFSEGRFSGQSRSIFLRLASGQSTVRQLAEEFGLEENAIYQLKKRIMTRFEEKAAALRAGGREIARSQVYPGVRRAVFFGAVDAASIPAGAPLEVSLRNGSFASARTEARLLP